MIKKNYSEISFFGEPANESVIADSLILLSEYVDMFDEFLFSNKVT